MDYPSNPKVGLHLGKFTDGAADGSYPPSLDPASWANAVTDEVRAVIMAGGLVPAEDNLHQLRDAIAAMIAASTETGLKALAYLDAGEGLEGDGEGGARIKLADASLKLSGGGLQLNSSVLTVSANTAITPAHNGNKIVTTAPLILTLPKASTVGGLSFSVYAQVGGAITLAPDASDAVQGGTVGASYYLPRGNSALVVTDGVSNWWLLYTTGKAPSRTTYTSGSGTYTPPVGVKQLRIRMVGGGGGGGSASTSSSHGGGGGTTSFGSVSAAGGGGGQAGGAGGAGGTGGAGSATVRIPGGSGGAAGGNGGGGQAGGTMFGGNGGGASYGAADASAGGANTGGGGGGGAAGSYGAQGGAGGGGAEGVELIITTPAASYAYAIGTGGTAGVVTYPGAAGAGGIIIIDEYF